MNRREALAASVAAVPALALFPAEAGQKPAGPSLRIAPRTDPSSCPYAIHAIVAGYRFVATIRAELDGHAAERRACKCDRCYNLPYLSNLILMQIQLLECRIPFSPQIARAKAIKLTPPTDEEERVGRLFRAGWGYVHALNRMVGAHGPCCECELCDYAPSFSWAADVFIGFHEGMITFRPGIANADLESLIREDVA